MGRPTKYTREVADKILDAMMRGESLRSICLDPDLPHKATIFRWVVDDREGFAEEYRRAQMVRVETLVDEIISLADEADADNVQAKRLQVDTRKWYACKLYPKYYGDVKQHKVEGELRHLHQMSQEDIENEIKRIAKKNPRLAGLIS